MQLIKSNSLILCISFTKNNMLCTITTLTGKTLLSLSAGVFKTKGLKKITSTTIFTLVNNLIKFKKNYKTLYLKIKGINKSKNELIKSLKIVGFNIILIQEKFSLPYGGCKNPKSRKL